MNSETRLYSSVAGSDVIKADGGERRVVGYRTQRRDAASYLFSVIGRKEVRDS
jgi:hypothetical protein